MNFRQAADRGQVGGRRLDDGVQFGGGFVQTPHLDQ
jgi:hypothetical protein